MRILSVAMASALALSAAGASAATIDLTAEGASATGTVLGGSVAYTMTATGGNLNNNQGFDGDAAPTGEIADMLAFDTDGYGVDGDEFTFPAEAIVVAFDKLVRLTGVAFLDLFNDADAEPGAQSTADVETGAGEVFTVSDEFVEILVDGASAFFVDSIENLGSAPGYAEASGLDLIGQTFTFRMGDASTRNDGSGDPDAALAAIQVAAVPVPAAGLLLLGALGGLGAFTRRRRGA